MLYQLVYISNGFSIPLFRLLNVLFHAGTTVVLYYIIKKLTNTKVAVLSTLFFSIHPIAVESVAWISAGIYPQSAFFFFLSFLCYISMNKSMHSKKYLILHWIFFIFSLLSSDKAIIYVILFFSYEWFYGSLGKNWKKLLFISCFSIFVFLLQSGRIAERLLFSSTLNSSNVISTNFITHISATIGMYLDRILFPSWLSIYPSIITVSQGTIIRWYLWTFGIILLFLYAIVKKKHFGFFISLFFISISYTLIPLPLASSYAERYTYVGYIGILVCVIQCIVWIMHQIYIMIQNKNGKFGHFPTYIQYGLFFIIFTLLFIRTSNRIADWKDTNSYILAAHRDSPNNPKVRNMMAEYYIGKNKYKEAINELETAISFAPNYLPAYFNLGLTYEQSGDIEKAIYWYKESLQRNPSQWQAAYQLGLIYKIEGNNKEAKDYLSKAYTITKYPEIQKEIEGL
jgi:protein O-mannosyl-transferase